MLAHAKLFVSPESYLNAERTADTRSEYIDGQIFAMAGASRNHNRIVTNVSSSLDFQLKEKDCNNYANDIKVSVQSGRRFVYPDVVVTCGKEEFMDEEKDVLLNPLIIIEVLSPSTEAYDRGTKFLYYQAIPSLREYVLVSQSTRRIEIYRKQSDGVWIYQSFSETATQVAFESAGCGLTMQDVYFKTE